MRMGWGRPIPKRIIYLRHEAIEVELHGNR
jgi:hypothetical protein